jgi:copper oxidase (laccase) domain-containing protein
MPQCPRCENETFFSHRGQNGKAGRFGVVAWWE